MDTMESTFWAETPLQFTSRHQPGGLAALAVDESECVFKGWLSTLCVIATFILKLSSDHGSLVPEAVEIYYEDISNWRKETFTHVDMIECMDGKPLSDKSIQDCLFNNPPSLPENTLPWLIESMNGKPVFLQLPYEKRISFEHYWNRMSFSCTPENEESVKDSTDSAKEEPESVLETYARKRNERLKRDIPEGTMWIS
ncbi:hypothetical protein TNCV_4569561 [Trichonephila clavipes]|nr:hypothetical protein TNCV_4569561 [Trichonephila clavipes]